METVINRSHTKKPFKRFPPVRVTYKSFNCKLSRKTLFFIKEEEIKNLIFWCRQTDIRLFLNTYFLHYTNEQVLA